jgi:hypothetical protein
MAKAEASVEELVGMIERGGLRLPEMQRRYVWRSPRVRDLLDSLYRNYPSGAILLWETDESVPLQEFAIEQQANPCQSTRLLLDGQQRLTSLAAVIRGQPVNVRGRKKPIELLFNLDHPDQLAVVTEVNEDGDDGEEDDELIEDEADSSEDELQRRFNRMTFVVATRKLEQLPHWVKVTDVFKSDLRTGPNVLDIPAGVISQLPPWDYLINIGRRKATRFEVYPIRLRDPLPRIRIPLKQGDEDAVLDLPAVFDQAYRAGRYTSKINYRVAPPIPLADDDAAWARQLLKKKGLRK